MAAGNPVTCLPSDNWRLKLHIRRLSETFRSQHHTTNKKVRGREKKKKKNTDNNSEMPQKDRSNPIFYRACVSVKRGYFFSRFFQNLCIGPGRYAFNCSVQQMAPRPVPHHREGWQKLYADWNAWRRIPNRRFNDPQQSIHIGRHRRNSPRLDERSGILRRCFHQQSEGIGLVIYPIPSL